jgi:hypothetical protein
MTERSVEQLQAADSALSRSFLGCVTTVVLSFCWAIRQATFGQLHGA